MRSRLLAGLALLVALLITVAVTESCADAGGPPVTAGASPIAEPSPAKLPGIESWPVSTADPAGRTLVLSATTVTPGEIITRTIGGAQPFDITASAMFLEVFAGGSWRTIYYLGLSQENPGYATPGPNVAITAVGLPPTALAVKIPDLPPGQYRLRQDMSSGGGAATPPAPITLYATIQVVAP